MANARQNKRHQKPNQAAERGARRTVEMTTEETKRMGEATARVGEEMARAGADLFQQNAQMFQKSWSFGADMATSLISRSSEQLGQRLGVSGDEARRSTDRSTRNAEAILYSATAVGKVLNDASQEYFDFMRDQLAKNMDRLNELWRCRTPQDVAALQSDLLRETVSDLFERNRRIAEMSRRLAEDAGTHIGESMQVMKRAA